MAKREAIHIFGNALPFYNFFCKLTMRLHQEGAVQFGGKFPKRAPGHCRHHPEVNLGATFARPFGPGPKGLRTGSPGLPAQEAAEQNLAFAPILKHARIRKRGREAPKMSEGTRSVRYQTVCPSFEPPKKVGISNDS